MTLEQLVTFLAVYHAGSYQKAAEQLYLPQPTVSNRIKQLERELNKLLFIRSKTGILLTEEGEALLPYARKVIDSIEEGKRAVDELKRGLSGKLSLGCNNSFACSVLPRILDSFASDYPDVSIRVHTYSTQDQLRKMKDNEFQLGISRYAMNVPQLTFSNIFQEEVRLIVSRYHPLATQRIVTMEQVAGEPLIVYQSDTLYRKSIDLTLGHHNLRYEIKYETNNLPLIQHWVRNGDGVFLSGAMFFREELQSREAVALPIEYNPFPPSQIFLMYKKDQLNSLDQLFMNHISAMMRREMAVGTVAL